MNKIFALLAALALFNVHVARGDGCKATVDGKEATLQAGDRYCSDDTTSKTCNSDGQFTEDKCPPESKCLKSPTGFSTLCRQIVKNNDKDNQAPPPAPAPAGQPQPESPKQGEPAPAPRDEGKQADQGAQAPTASDSDSCDGGAFKAGQRRCKSNTTYSVCNWGGVWIDGDCPPESKCMENKDQKQVLCRQVKKNAPWPTGPSGSEGSNSNQQPKVSKRSAQDQAPQQAGQPPVDPRTKTCTGPAGTFKSGERFCKSASTTSLCAYGEWVDYECPSGSQCLENKEQKQVLCRQYVTNPPQQNRPGEGPNSNNQPKRFRRDTQDKAAVPKQDDQPRQATDDPRSRTCTGPAGTYKLGERYCSSETGSSVCAYGQWVNFDCPPGSRCLENKEQKQVLCRQYVTNPPQQQPSNEGPNSNNQPKRFKRDNQDKAAFPKQADQGAQPPVDPRTKKCTGPAGTFNSGESFCKSRSTTSLCAYGEWVDYECPSASTCEENKDLKQVLCRQYVTNPPQANGQNQRFKRDNNETATPTGTEAPETCTSDKGTFKTGDRYCKSETTHTVCNYGQWIDGECDAGSKCMENKDLKQVLCRIVNKNAPWPAGPSGSEAQNPEPQAASLPPQASPQPNPQPQPTPQPAPEAQPQPTPQPAPQPQPQPQPSQGSEGTPQPSQPKPTGTEAPLPAIPAQEPKDCEGGLKEAEQVCTGDNGYKMCHDGQFITEACPPNSKCLASTASKHVLCREIRRSVVVEKPQERRR